MTRFVLSCAAVACLALAGCGKAEEEIDPAPVAQLQGPWQMINRALDCDTSYTVFSPVGVHRLYEGGAKKKYFSIKKFTLEAGKFTLLTTGIARDPEEELSLVFSLEDRQIRLLDIRTDRIESFKQPPKEFDEAQQAYLKSLFKINEQRFALDRCAGA
jgi:hypothetical protein